MARALPNYIRPLRRRTGLSQSDVAILLGVVSGTSVLRHEDNQRAPTMDTALAYAVILRSDLRGLFAGRYEAVEADVRRRARRLLVTVMQQPYSAENARKATYLSALVKDPELHYVPWRED